MEFFNRIITHYGWEGTALAGVLLVMFGIQLYYYLFVYGRIPKYKDTRRPEILSETPPVSVVIPLFSEDYAFVEEILPLIVAQEYPTDHGHQDRTESPLPDLAQNGAQRRD